AVLMLATMGIVLIFRTSITTNFSQGMMATFSAFIAATLMGKLINSIPGISSPLALTIGIVAGIIVAFLMGLFVDTMIIRKSKFVTSAGKQMITMGLVLVLTGLIPVIFGTLPIDMPRFSYEILSFNFLGLNLTIPVHNLITILAAFIVITIVFVALKFTKWGLGVRATASNEMVAGMMGVNTFVITALSWSIAGALGALSASLYAPSAGNLTSGLMVTMQVNGFLAAILGSFSSFIGPVVGSLIIPISTGIIAFFSPVWRDVIVYVLVLVIVLIKPVGLFGKKISKKV
ncbi:MAG: branched-chain amino acid ABC transporter permease, partial [Acholeplasma sp.]|nr:branched-chain amino acid ABC transporter permease [Acholeplasma sp.]